MFLANVEFSMSRGPQFRLSRVVVLFAAGLAGVLHETFVSNGERPSLLILYGAMMGLPIYLRKNGK